MQPGHECGQARTTLYLYFRRTTILIFHRHLYKCNVNHMSSIARRIAPTKASEPPKAVDVLDSDIAKAYAHIHPLLILSVYFFNLSSIIADPVSALSTLLLPVSALQIAYSSLCLPATGASDASPSTLKAGARKKQGQGKSDGGIGSKVVVSPPRSLLHPTEIFRH